MSGYVMRSEESKAVKKLIKKYGVVPIKIDNPTNTRTCFFSVNINYAWHIKKVKWIG